MSEPIVALSLDPETILQISHDGLRVVIYFKPEKVPVGTVGMLTVKDANGWEQFQEGYDRDKANLRVDARGKLYLQNAGASSTVPPARERVCE